MTEAPSHEKAPPALQFKTTPEGDVDWSQLKDFTVPEQDALALLEAANHLSDASTADELGLALDHNLKLWIAIKTVISEQANSLPEEVKKNLRILSEHVAKLTLSIVKGGIEPQKVLALASIDMHIAEGLLRGQVTRMIRDRAHEIWEERGRPQDRDLEHWLMAEREIQAAIEGT